MVFEEICLANVEIARRINRKASDQYLKRGMLPADISLAAVLSAFDISAIGLGGDPHAAIEAMRTSLDYIERNLLAQAASS